MTPGARPAGAGDTTSTDWRDTTPTVAATLAALERALGHARTLQAITADFAGLLDSNAVAEVVFGRVVPLVRARAGALFRCGVDGALELVRMSGYSPTVVARITAEITDDARSGVPLDAAVPVAEVARTGTPRWIPSLASELARWPALAHLAEAGIGASAALPLRIGVVDVGDDPRPRERAACPAPGVIGVLAIDFGEAHSFDDEERAFLEAVAGQCAQAIERARLHEAERAARQAAASSDAALRLAQVAANVGTWAVDLVNGAVTWSPEYYQLHGLDPARHRPLQATWLASVHPEDRPQVQAQVRAAIDGTDPAFADAFDVEYRILRPDGATRWILGRGRVERDAATGRAVRLAGANLDITGRRVAEAHAAASEAQLRRVLDALFAFVGLLSPDGTLVEANLAPLERAGLSIDDVRGRKFWEAPWWTHDPAVVAELREALAAAARGDTVRYDVPVAMGTLADGSPRLVTIDFMVAPLRDEHGRITHLVPSAVDVSERAAALRALQVASSQRDAALAAGALGTFELSLGDDAVRVAGSTLALFGYDDEAPHAPGPRDDPWAPPQVARPAADFFARVHPDDADRVQAAIRRTVEEGAPHAIEYRVVHPDGTVRRLASRAILQRDDGGAPASLMGALVDVTERADALNAAEAANRAKAEFLAVMSHELRTPLNAIQGHVHLLQLGIHGPLTEAQRESLGRVHKAQRHLLGLINDVLNYAKLESGTVQYAPEPLAVGDVVDDVRAIIEPLASARSLALAFESRCPDHRILADREKLAQVLVNLLGNAVKFTEPGGSVTLRIAPEAPPPGGVRHQPGAAGWVRLDVVDTGIGIPRDRLGAIFEPFVQVHAGHTRPHEGTGLGLAISRELARGMGGDLTVTSAVGEGSTFTVWLPAAP